MSRVSRFAVLVAILITNFLASIDVNIVSTAMPKIISDVGGVSLLPWFFSGFLLTSAVTIPIYGSLSDIYGRKKSIIAATAFLLLGSLLCAFSTTMLELIIFRSIQGLGAAGIIAVSTTIVGDIYTPEERGNIQGWISTIWGACSVVGPILGTFLPEWFGWSSVFSINIPFCLIAIVLIGIYFNENLERKKTAIDYPGIASLTVSITLLMFIFLNGGTTFPWLSWPIVMMGIGFILLFVLFVVIEHHSKNPLLSPTLFRSPIVFISFVGSFIIGGMNMCMYSYIPSYSQGVFNTSSTLAGLILTPMSIAWILSQFALSKGLKTWGYKWLAVLGFVTILIASVILMLVNVTFGIWSLMIAMAFMGFGLGLSLITLTIAVQSSVDWNQRGTVTSSLQFIRNLGKLVAVSVMGAIINMKITQSLNPDGNRANPLDEINLLFDETTRQSLDPSRLNELIHAYDASLHYAFLLLVIVSSIGLLCSFKLPDPTKEKYSIQA